MKSETKKVFLPEKKFGGATIDLIVDGKEKKTIVWRGEVVEGHDINGIRLQITRPNDSEWKPFNRFKWRFHKGPEDEDWSFWFFTHFSPTEQISEIKKNAPTVAQVFKAADGKPCGSLPYGERWNLYRPRKK